MTLAHMRLALAGYRLWLVVVCRPLNGHQQRNRGKKKEKKKEKKLLKIVNFSAGRKTVGIYVSDSRLKLVRLTQLTKSEKV